MNRILLILLLAASTLLASAQALKPFNDHGKWGYIDKYGTLIIQVSFNFANSFDGGIAKVEKNKKYVKKELPIARRLFGKFRPSLRSL